MTITFGGGFNGHVYGGSGGRVPFTKIRDHPERYFEGSTWPGEPISFPRESMRLIVDILPMPENIPS